MDTYQDDHEEPYEVKDWREETIADRQEMWEVMSSDDELPDQENDGSDAHFDTYDLGE